MIVRKVVGRFVFLVHRIKERHDWENEVRGAISIYNSAGSFAPPRTAIDITTISITITNAELEKERQCALLSYVFTRYFHRGHPRRFILQRIPILLPLPLLLYLFLFILLLFFCLLNLKKTTSCGADSSAKVSIEIQRFHKKRCEFQSTMQPSSRKINPQNERDDKNDTNDKHKSRY